MRLSFDSIDEVKEFVKGLKGTRGGKNDAGDDEQLKGGNAPAPLMPNTAGQVAGGFPGTGGAAPGAGAGPMGAGPFAGGAAAGGQDQAQVQMVTRIIGAMDAAVSSGRTSVDNMLAWFRQECAKVDATAANATLDQIKGVYLYRMGAPALEGLAKAIGA